MSAENRFRDRLKSNFLLCDFIAVVFVTLCFVAWVELFGGKAEINKLFAGNRNNIYAALVSIFGSLLGFIITTMSIITTWTGREKMEELRRKPLYPQLWDSFQAAIYALAFVVIVSIVTLVFDRDTSSYSLLWHLLFFGVFLATMRTYRCVWLLRKLIDMVAGPIRADDPPEPTVPGPTS